MSSRKRPGAESPAARTKGPLDARSAPTPTPLPGGAALPAEDRFASVAAHYDAWVGWEPRLKKEMPFLVASIPAGATVLDAGCGTGAHARALAGAGYRVTGADTSAAMLAQAHAAESRDARAPGAPAVEWVECDITSAAAIDGRRFDAVLALGNVLPAFGDAEAVARGLGALVTRTAPGGLLILQYLNGERVRARGRLVVKGSNDDEGGVWLRHHFEAGGKLWFHSYQLSRTETGWTGEVRAHEYNDVSAAEVMALLGRLFDQVELFDGLTGNPFDPLESDSLGVRATGRHS
jgi:SAM-dependent methyltransferase